MYKVIELNEMLEDGALCVCARISEDDIQLNIECSEWSMSHADFDAFRKFLNKAAKERDNV